MDDRCIRLAAERTKARRARMIPLTDAAIAAIKLTTGKRIPSAFVFTNRLGTPYVRNGLLGVCRSLGITPYALRHTFAQSALDQIDMATVAAWLGHANLSTVQTYAQIRDQRLRVVARTLVSPAQLAIDAEAQPRPSGSAKKKKAERPLASKRSRKKHASARRLRSA